jgi:hypothetical protein
MADDGSSDSSKAREALLAPLYTKELGDPPIMSPVVCSGRLRFADLDPSGQPNLATARGTVAKQRSGSGGGGGGSSDGAWCELFADPDMGETQLAVFDDSRRLDRNTAGADPRELLTFIWKTKALMPRAAASSGGVHFFTIAYVFSAMHDERFDGGGGGGGDRKHARVERVAVLANTAGERTEWFQKLQAALQMIPQPMWMGPLSKKPTKGTGARRALTLANRRFFVLDGPNLIYYTDNKLLKEKGQIALTADATVSLVNDASSGVPNFTLVVGNRTLVAESLQSPQLRLADIENWVLKIQQTIDALVELDQQALAEASQPEPQGGDRGADDSSFGADSTLRTIDDLDGEPAYDDDGNLLTESARLSGRSRPAYIPDEQVDGYTVSSRSLLACPRAHMQLPVACRALLFSGEGELLIALCDRWSSLVVFVVV